MTDHLEPGEPCRSPQARKVEYSHLTREDVMIRAYNRRHRPGPTNVARVVIIES